MKTQHIIQDTIWKSAALNDCLRKQKKCFWNLMFYHLRSSKEKSKCNKESRRKEHKESINKTENI